MMQHALPSTLLQSQPRLGEYSDLFFDSRADLMLNEGS